MQPVKTKRTITGPTPCSNRANSN